MKNVPTLSLLYSSVLISFSGAFRIAIAYLFIGAEISPLNIIAGFLIIYSTYTFDRIIGGEEDKINRNELAQARNDIAMVVCLFSFVAGAFMLFLEDLLIISFIPITIGVLYSKGVNIGDLKIRLKGGLGMKNFTVALTWGAFITGIVMQDSSNLLITASVFSFIFVKTFINTTINDFRDINGDKAAGLMTLPICLGEKGTKILLMLIHVIEHVFIIIIMITGILEFELVIIMSCLISGMIYIPFIRSQTKKEPDYQKFMHKIFYKFEFYLALGSRTLLQNFYAII